MSEAPLLRPIEEAPYDTPLLLWSGDRPHGLPCKKNSLGEWFFKPNNHWKFFNIEKITSYENFTLWPTLPKPKNSRDDYIKTIQGNEFFKADDIFIDITDEVDPQYADMLRKLRDCLNFHYPLNKDNE